MLTFTKKCDATSQGIAKKCHACGAPMDVNNSGKCDYCGSIYKQEEHDWVLENLIKISKEIENIYKSIII